MLWTSTRLVSLLLAGLAVGCGPRISAQRVTDLRSRVADLQHQLRAEKQRVEDLNNRLFLLQDELDTRRQAARKTPVARPSARSVPPKARVNQARPRPRPAVRRPTATELARLRARRRLPVVKLRRQARRVRRTRHARRGPPRITVLRLTGQPAVPRLVGRRRKVSSMGPVPQVTHRLPVVPLPGATAPIPRAASTSAETDYRTARALYVGKKYAAAGQAFARFARTHPRHGLADNARYWLAECFYRRGQVAKAAWVLRKLLRDYPRGNKAPSALLKLAVCERRLGRRAKAAKIFAQVMQLYPKSAEAARAARHLRRGR